MGQNNGSVAGNASASTALGAQATTATGNKPLISVYGATSKQGRSVAAALLESGRFRVRAITRNRDSKRRAAWSSSELRSARCRQDRADTKSLSPPSPVPMAFIS
jgi:hypothetical protein